MPKPNDTKKNLLDLLKIMEWSLALAFGVLAAWIASVKKLFEDGSLEFNLWTLLAPAIVLTLNRLFWRHVRGRAEKLSAKDAEASSSLK